MRRFLRDSGGQDLLEYILLASFLAISGWAGVQVLSTAMHNSYERHNSATQGIWETPEPIRP